MDVEKTTRDTIARGGVLALLYFDIHANSKEAAQHLATGFVQDILKREGVVYALGEIDEPIVDKEIHSTNVQVKILVRSFPQLAAICAVNSPFAIEILKPDEIRLPINQAHELLHGISTTTADYKKFIIERLAKPEDMEKYRHFMQKKVEMGEKILGRKAERGGSEEGKKGEKGGAEEKKE